MPCDSQPRPAAAMPRAHRGHAGNTPGMNKSPIRSAMAPGPLGAASPGVSAGRFVFVSGQLPLSLDGEISGGTAAEQAGRAIDNLVHQLRSTGLSLDDVVSLEDPSRRPGRPRGARRRARGVVRPALPRSHVVRCTMVARRCAAPGGRHRATLLRSHGCRETISPRARRRFRASSTWPCCSSLSRWSTWPCARCSPDSRPTRKDGP